jgi:hypothetical protein
MALMKQSNGIYQMHKINLASISKYTDLPSILNDRTSEVKYKNYQSIIREFENEKWKSLISLSESSNTEIKDLSAMMHSELSLKPFLYQGSIYVDTPLNISNKFIEHSIHILKNIYTENECSSLVEVGAGYGRLLIPLVDSMEDSRAKKILGLDLTESSGLILSNLSNRLNYNIESSVIDISGKNAVCHNKKLLLSAQKPLIFSCQTLMYAPKVDDDFINLMKIWPDGIFCNIEPVFYENASNDLQKLQRKYVVLNDYNRNLEEKLFLYADKDLIEILYSEDLIISENAFLPLKVYLWKFV